MYKGGAYIEISCYFTTTLAIPFIIIRISLLIQRGEYKLNTLYNHPNLLKIKYRTLYVVLYVSPCRVEILEIREVLGPRNGAVAGPRQNPSKLSNLYATAKNTPNTPHGDPGARCFKCATTNYRLCSATLALHQIASSMSPTRPAARISFSLSCFSTSSGATPVNMVQNEPIVRPSHLTGAPR